MYIPLIAFSLAVLSALVLEFFLPTAHDPAKVSVPKTMTKIFLIATVHPELLDRTMCTVSSCSLDSSNTAGIPLLSESLEATPEDIASSIRFTLSCTVPADQYQELPCGEDGKCWTDKDSNGWPFQNLLICQTCIKVIYIYFIITIIK